MNSFQHPFSPSGNSLTGGRSNIADILRVITPDALPATLTRQTHGMLFLTHKAYSVPSREIIEGYHNSLGVEQPLGFEA